MDFKHPATTPRVMRSPFIERGKVVIFDGSQFEDGLRRIVVAQGVSDDDALNITDALTQAEYEEAILREQMANARRVFDAIDPPGMYHQSTDPSPTNHTNGDE